MAAGAPARTLSPMTTFTVRRLVAVTVTALAVLVAPLVTATPAQAQEDISQVWYPWQAPDRADVARATKVAKKQWDQGDQYVLGDEGPSTFDCSGLVYYAFHDAGATFARYSTKDLYLKGDGPAHLTGRRVGRWEIKPGDIIFYSNNGLPSGIYHSAIYLGWNPGSAKNEQIEAMNPTDDIRVNQYRTTGALDEVLRIFG